MKRVLQLKLMFVVVLFALSANIATVWGQTSIKDQQRAARRVFNKEAKGASLKGGAAGNPIPTLAVSYCSEDGSVVISIDVDDLEDATASIDWRIREFVGGETYHPEWGDIEGSGRNTTLRFYPSRVDAQFHNSTAIYISAFEKDGSGFVIKGTHDFTTVYATPAEFTIGTDQAICAGLTVSLTLDGSEEDVEYQLKRDGVDVSFPLAGNGNPLTWNGISDGGVYTVTANNSIENSCSKDMLGSATLTVYNLPNPVATNGGNVCLGDDIELFADPDGLTSYTWTDPATTEIGTTQDVTVSSTGYGVGTHTFTLSVEDANTCVNTVTTNVTVYEIPTVTATNSGPVCLNGDITISSTVTGGQAPYNYTWTHVPSGTTYNTDAFTLNNVALDKAGEYQLVVTDANNCSPATASTIVVINENPTVTLPAGPTNVCEGNALTLTATANGGSGVYDTYTWYFNGAEIVGQTAATLTINPAAIANGGNYTVIVTDNNGCVSPLSNVSTVVIIPNFTPTVTNDSPVCEGGDVQLSCTSGPYVDYSWTGPDGFSSVLQNPVVSGITLAGAGNYSLTVTDANGCTGTEVTNVLVNENPTVTVADNGPLCVGGSAIITATPTGGAGPYTYSWTHNANPLVPTGNVITIDPVALADAGDYVVSVTDNNTCSSVVSATTTLVVNDNPTVSLSYNNPVCENGTLTLTATAAGGSGVYNTYAWTKGGVAIPGETGATLTINPATLADAGDYGVTVIDNSGCNSTEDIVTVVINALPAVTATNNGPICEGDQLELTGGPGGMTTYSWTGPNGYTNATQSPIVSANATLAMAGAYQLEVFDGTCSASATTNVVINTVTAVLTHTPASFTVCENTLLTFSANGQDGSGNYEYEFFVNGVSQGPASTTNALPLTITSNVNVEVEVTDTNTGCKDRADTDITMIANPVIAITSPNDMDEFCTGEPITFNFTPGYTEYVLYAGPAGTPTELYRGATPSFTLAAGFNTTTDVAVSAENISGCSALSNIITIVINNRPTPTITGDTEVCANDAKTYTTDSGSGESNWQWNITGGTIVGADNTASVDVVWDGPAPHTITVNYDNSDGCPAVTPTSQAITVNPLPVPTVTGDNIVCNGSTVTYSTETGMTGYTWVVTGGNLDSQDDAAGTATVTWSTVGTQNLTVSYTDANSCSPATPFAYGVQVVALPSPTITGDNVVCTEHTYTYSTEPGATNYNWQIVGGTITPTANDHEVNVVWNTTTGTEQISVNYELAACPAATPTILNVTVNTVPTPAIVGSLNVCANSTESYEANILGLGKGQYTWLVTGGTPTGDLDDESVEVIWNGTAPHTISLNYVNANGCDAVNPTVENVTVNALPLPIITGPAVACDGSTVTYSTETGMTAYTWNVVGGTLDSQDDAAGTATVTWNVVGMQSIGVTYTDGNNCNPSTPTIYNVEVVSLPSPTITGDNIVCTEHTYTYITEAGASNYDWQIVGGTITPTANPHEVSVVWNLLGAQSISVNYDVAGCPASAPTVQNVTVSAVPTPSIVGNLTVCANSTETYSANTLGLGKGQYTWLVTGGTPTGDLDEESVEVLWDGTAPHTISLNYVNANGCDAVNPTLENVTVNALPVPTISGPAAACKDYEVDYTTEAGMTGTTWNVLSGGVIQSQDDASGTVTVLWNATGSHKLTVTYTDANGCVAQMPIEYDVNVQDIPTPSLNGLTDVCNQQTVTYTTEAGMTNYDWQIASGGSIETNDDNGTITVLWNTDGDHTLSVNYELAGGCAAPNATQVTVTVKPLPAAPFVVAPGNSVVAGTDLTFTAGGGANYTFDVNGDVKQGPGAATDYLASTSDPTPDVVDGDIVSVIIESANGCSVSRSITMNVFEGVIVLNTEPATQEYCAGSPDGLSIYLSGGVPQVGMSYRLVNETAGNLEIGVINVVDASEEVRWTHGIDGINFDLTGITTYRIEAFYPAVPGSEVSMNGKAVITQIPLPTVFDVESTSPNPSTGCGGDGHEITLNGSEVGINYILQVGGASSIPVAGDGNAISFGKHRTPGIYSVVADNGSCTPITMNGTFEIISDFTGSKYDVTMNPVDGRFCDNGVATGVEVVLGGSDNGITYTVYRNLTNELDSWTSTVDGESHTFGPYNINGDYNITAETASGCTEAMNNSVTITAVAEPLIFNLIAGDLTYCQGSEGVTISLDNKQVDVFYSLYKDGTLVVDTLVEVDGGVLNFEGLHDAGVYTAKANIPGLSCEVDMNGNITVNELALPDIYTLVGDTEYCIGGGAAVLSIPASQNNVKYTLYRNPGDNYVDEQIGDGNSIQFMVSVDGSYYLTAETINPISCSQLMNGTIDVSGVAFPNQPTINFATNGSDCDQEMIVRLTDVEVGVQYELIKELPIGSGIYQATGNIVIGDPVNEPNTFAGFKDNNARYFVRATRAKCPIVFTGVPINVSIANSLKRFSITGVEDICNGDAGITLGLSESELQVDGLNVEYTLYLVEGNPDGTDRLISTQPGTGAAFDFPVLINEGVKYYVLGQQIPANPGDPVCPPQPMLDTVEVNIYPLPIAYEIVGSGYYCDALGATIGINNTEDGVLYQLQYTTGGISRNIGAAKPGLADGSGFDFTDGAPFTIDTYGHADGVFTIVAYNPVTLCTSSMNGSISLTEKADFADITITSGNNYCSDENGIRITTDLSELEAKYTLFKIGVGPVITIDGTGNEIDFGYQKAGTYRIDVSWGEDGCLTEGHVPEFEITESLNPIIQKVSVDKSNICGTQDVTISIEGREADVIYTLYELGDHETGPALSVLDDSDPAALDFELQTVSVDTDYEVYAGGTGVCERLMGFASVSVKSAPTLFEYITECKGIVGDTAYCSGTDSVQIAVVNSELNIGYRLIEIDDSGTKVGTKGFIEGTGNNEYFSGMFGQGQYVILSTNFESGCDWESTDTIKIVENPLPVRYSFEIDNGDGTIEECNSGCNGLTNVSLLQLNGSQIGFTYSLLRNGNPIDPDPVDSIAKTINGVEYGTRSNGGSYTVRATSDKGCQSLMDGYIDLFERRLIAENDILSVKYGSNQGDTSVWYNDQKDVAIDRLVGSEGKNKNIYFKLLACDEELNPDDLVPWDSEAPQPKHTKDRNGNDLNLVEMYVDGSVVFTKLPSFYGRDSIDYVVYNTDYLDSDRYDRGRIYFFAGNVTQAEDELLIPNAFSPNGDLINDEFEISQFKSEPTESKLEVYNRWGSIVYRSKGNKYGIDSPFWDGTSNAGMVSLGKKLPSGTYFYVFKVDISVEEESGSTKTVSKEYSGFIELRR